MTHTKTIAWAAGLTILALGAWASGGIEGSKHDFSHKDWSGGDACGVCHLPGSDEPPTAAPLWNQNADLNRTFGTPLLDSKAAGLGTTMCLRCHDGTIARDAIARERIAGAKRERFVNKENPGLYGTGHGTSEHPVGVDYPKIDKGYRPAASVIAYGTVTLPGGKVECISCHDPHNMSGQKYMLVSTNARSRLCLTCHRK
jgi:predicted CXXCH cytochrome family protein